MAAADAKLTRATLALSKAGIAFTAHRYAYDPGADRVGMQAAEALGLDPAGVLKTLMTLVDGKGVCVIVPSDREVNMKALAAALGGKSAAMMRPADAERATGYVVGGISPFGQKKTHPTLLEADAMTLESVMINGGQRGLLLRLRPQDALAATNALAAHISG